MSRAFAAPASATVSAWPWSVHGLSMAVVASVHEWITSSRGPHSWELASTSAWTPIPVRNAGRPRPCTARVDTPQPGSRSSLRRPDTPVCGPARSPICSTAGSPTPHRRGPRRRCADASVIEHHLKPLLGHLAVKKLTTMDIDDVYRHLLRAGGPEGATARPWHRAPGRRRVASSLDPGRALGMGVAQPGQRRLALAGRRRPRYVRRHRIRCSGCSPTSRPRTRTSPPICGWPPRPERGAASCSGCAGPRSTSVTPRSASPAPTSKARRDRCCAPPRRIAATAWRSMMRRSTGWSNTPPGVEHRAGLPPRSRSPLTGSCSLPTTTDPRRGCRTG